MGKFFGQSRPVCKKIAPAFARFRAMSEFAGPRPNFRRTLGFDCVLLADWGVWVMVYFDIIQFCLANASRSNRMASCVHDPSLKAMYVESTNHWRHLAEQMKSARPDQAVQRAITDMGRADFAPSILEAPERTVRQIAQSRHDNVKSEK